LTADFAYILVRSQFQCPEKCVEVHGCLLRSTFRHYQDSVLLRHLRCKLSSLCSRRGAIIAPSGLHDRRYSGGRYWQVVDRSPRLARCDPASCWGCVRILYAPPTSSRLVCLAISQPIREWWPMRLPTRWSTPRRLRKLRAVAHRLGLHRCELRVHRDSELMALCKSPSSPLSASFRSRAICFVPTCWTAGAWSVTLSS